MLSKPVPCKEWSICFVQLLCNLCLLQVASVLLLFTLVQRGGTYPNILLSPSSCPGSAVLHKNPFTKQQKSAACQTECYRRKWLKKLQKESGGNCILPEERTEWHEI